MGSFGVFGAGRFRGVFSAVRVGLGLAGDFFVSEVRGATLGSGFLPFSCCFFSSCTLISLFFGYSLTGDLEGSGGGGVGRAVGCGVGRAVGGAVAFKGWDTGNGGAVLGGERGVAAVTFEGIA